MRVLISSTEGADRPWVTRVQITGGFLAGLDLSLARGLNVIIGARGAGKTTLLELIRFAMGAPYLTPEADQADRAFIRQMLGDGEVILDLAGVGDRPRRLIATAENAGTAHLFDDQSLFIGQNGLEIVASNAQSRARLIDLQAGLRELNSDLDVAGLTHELLRLRQLTGQLQEELRARPSLERDLLQLELDEAVWRGRSGQEAEAKVADLQSAETDFRSLTLAHEHLTALQRSTAVSDDLAQRVGAELELAASADLPTEVLTRVAAATDAARVLTDRLTELANYARADSNLLGAQLDDLRSRILRLRAELEDLDRGRGEVAERINHARLTLSRLSDVEKQLQVGIQRYEAVRAQRRAALTEREREGERRYAARQQVAQDVTRGLDDRIRVEVDHLGDSANFHETLTSALQGSGLRYSAIADTIAQALLPQDLLECVEEGRVDELTAVAGIARDRAQRALLHLSTPDNLTKLANATLDDAVYFFLRDGAAHKAMEQLSTGQKCATVLPIILMDRMRALFLDQPEDHLDNAFLVGNVVGSLSRRSESGAQTIVATHNPNIPVLGEAKLVCALVSDGTHADVDAAGEFREHHIVDAITNLMEGGAEAFRRRAEFYRDHGILG